MCENPRKDQDFASGRALSQHSVGAQRPDSVMSLWEVGLAPPEEQKPYQAFSELTEQRSEILQRPSSSLVLWIPDEDPGVCVGGVSCIPLCVAARSSQNTTSNITSINGKLRFCKHELRETRILPNGEKISTTLTSRESTVGSDKSSLALPGGGTN